MSIEISALDEMQKAYKEATEEWIAAIREEEALATVNHDVAEVDLWEQAADREEAARDRAKDAKKAYEDALRQKFYNF